MDEPTGLELAVRENVTWCDLVCRSHRLTPEADASVWWSARRTPTRFPDAITLRPGAGEIDVLGRIRDTPGASVKDSFATLDLEPQGYRVLFEATWVARPPTDAPPSTLAAVQPVTDKFTFAAWRRAWGGPDDVLLPGLLRTGGVTVLGGGADGFDRGAILHHTKVRGVEVVGVSNAFGPRVQLVGAAAARFPGAWIVGYEPDPTLPAVVDLGFQGVGPLRVWARGDA